MDTGKVTHSPPLTLEGMYYRDSDLCESLLGVGGATLGGAGGGLRFEGGAGLRDFSRIDGDGRTDFCSLRSLVLLLTVDLRFSTLFDF